MLPTTNMSSQTILSTFENLPGELLNQITDRLDLEAAKQLCQTNKYFYSIIELSNRPTSAGFVAKFENRNTKLDGPRLARHSACSVCSCLKPSTIDVGRWTATFTQQTGACQWYARSCRQTVEERHFRVCAECLTKHLAENMPEATPKGMIRFLQQQEFRKAAFGEPFDRTLLPIPRRFFH